MIIKRNRRKQTVSFDERLRSAAKQARESAQMLPHGAAREDLRVGGNDVQRIGVHDHRKLAGFHEVEDVAGGARRAA